MAKGHDEFTRLLTNARDVAFVVAEHLTVRGHRVRVVPNTVSPTFAERWEHTDNGDLEITQRVEVKHWPGIDFQSRHEVPYENVIVDEAYKVEKAHEVPLYAYVIVNASKTGFLLIPTWTRDAWFKQRKHDKREGSMREFYFCPLARVYFQRMRKK